MSFNTQEPKKNVGMAKNYKTFVKVYSLARGLFQPSDVVCRPCRENDKQKA